MRRRIVGLVVVVATLTACETGAEGERERGRSVPVAAPTGGFGPQQLTLQTGRATIVDSAAGHRTTGRCWTTPALREYRLAGRGTPGEVAAAGDGAVWFTDPVDVSVSRLEPSGELTRYRLPDGRTPASLAVAADGSVWFTTTGPAIAHLTPSGHVVGYAVPPTTPMRWGSTGAPGALSAGPDGNIWFVDSQADKVGRITTEGTITDHPLPSGERQHVHPETIVAGPDDAMWFSEPLAGRLGRIDTHTFAIKEFPIPPDHTGVPTGSVTVGPDHSLWFDGGTGLGRMTTTGDARWFPLTGQGPHGPTSVAGGPDGQIWTIDGLNGKVLRMTPHGEVSELPALADPGGLTPTGLRQMSVGSDAVWLSEPGLNRIGRYACPS